MTMGKTGLCLDVSRIGDPQKALDQLPPAGGTLIFPPGTYDIDRTLVCRLREGQHLELRGAGRTSILRYTARDGSHLLALDGVPDSWWPDLRLSIRDLTFVGNHDCGDALHLRWPNDALIDTCAFFGFGGTAIRVTPQATNVTIRDCWMRDCRRALHADNLHHLTFHGNQTRSIEGGQIQDEHIYIGRHCREVRLVNNHLAYGHAEGIILNGTAQHVIANNTIEGFTHGIRARDCRDISISANYIHSPCGILIEEDTRGMVISGNVFTNNPEGAVVIREAAGSGGHAITSNIIRQSVYNDGQGGIDLGEARNCVVRGNVLEDIDHGPALAGQTDTNIVHDNVVADTADVARKTCPEAPATDCDPRHPLRPLYDWLVAQPENTTRLTMSFWALRKLLGGPLPEAAEKEPGWWANDPDLPQARAWLAADWLVVFVKRIEGQIVLARSRPHEG